MASSNVFNGRRVLVLEDDYWIMADLVRELGESGADIVGPCSNIEQALVALGADRVDGAIIDVNVQGKKAFAVADVLIEKSIPFVFATGYDANEIPESF